MSSWPPLPRLRGLFVTGTDTGVGKTLIAGAVAQYLRHAGRRVEVFKPVASGCRLSRGELVSTDATFLAACADSGLSLSEIAPLRFAASLAPNVAASREGRTVDLKAIFDAYRRIEARSDLVIVEGIGGLLCPISDEFWVIHLARMMALPLVIVAAAGLGTINHTLLTIHAARSAGLNVAGVVVNRYPPDLLADPGSHLTTCPDGDLAILTNPSEIARLGKVPILTSVPNEPANSVDNASIGPDTQFTIAQVPWEQITG